MAPAQLARLRPQITALSSLFGQPKSYIKALVGLLETYRSEIDLSASGITTNSLIKKLNVPQIIITQLGISFNHLCQVFPDQTVQIAENIWDKEFFEYKQISLLLLSKLSQDRHAVFFKFIDQWVNNETESPIFSVILDNINSNPQLRNDERWLEIIGNWMSSGDLRLKKFGLKAVADLVSSEKQYPHPNLLKEIKPAFSNPTLSVYSELLEIIELLTSLSMNETAALIISLGIQNPNANVKKFIRKCLPFFTDSVTIMIKDSVQI